jgi:hypothetical protein
MNPRCHACRTGEAGYALVGTVVLAFAILIIAMAFFNLAGYETKGTQVNLASQRAFWLAEAGKERSLNKLTGLPTPPLAETRLFDHTAGPDGGTYTVDCLFDSAGMWLAEKRFVLDCVGSFGGMERRIRQRIKMTSFAQYAYFTVDERTPAGDPIWFITGDQIHGLVHSNATFRISGSPRFFDRVTSAADRMIGYKSYSVYDASGWPVGGNNPRFDQGFTLDVVEIPLPSQTLDLQWLAQHGGLFLSPASTIELGKRASGVAAQGWLRYRNTPPPSTAPWSEASITLLANKVVYVNNPLNLSGNLRGELTIACKRDISIVDDITYSQSDASGAPLPGCTDLLGLVSEKNILFKNDPATKDLKVDAVLMALDTSIQAENYDTRAASAAGTLTIWGGLIQKYRGPVGTSDASGHIVTGYVKDYHYDTRVTARTPPAFPLTGVYQETEWAETWDASNPF